MSSLKNTIINDTGYIMLPSGTSAQRPAPQNGMVRYNTDLTSYEIYTNGVWSQFTSNIVLENLALYLQPDNSKSYPGLGSDVSKIYDLANSNSGNLTDITAYPRYLNFNSTSSSISLNTNLFITGAKSISFWLRTNRPLSDNDDWEIGFLNQGSTPGSMFGMMYGVGQTQDLGFWGYAADYDYSINNPTTRWIDLNTWVFVTCTINSSRQVKIYKNNVQQLLYRNSDGATALTFSLPVETTNYFLINSRGSWGSGFTYLNLGDVLVYNKELSLSEITQNYNSLRSKYA
jgi:hypothetical protein